MARLGAKAKKLADFWRKVAIVMGSTGAAPKSSGESEDHPKRLNVAVNAETRAVQGTIREASTSNELSATAGIDRIERLLTQLEAKSVALVPHGYWSEPQARVGRSNSGLVPAAIVGCVWLLGLALFIAYSHNRHSAPFAEGGQLTQHSPVVLNLDSQDLTTAQSMDHLAQALVSSSNRLNELEAAVMKSDRNLQQLETKMFAEGAKTVPTRPASGSGNDKTRHDPAIVNPIENPISIVTVLPTPGLDAPIPKVPSTTPYQVASVKPTDAAVPHKTADGKIDYWLVARGAFKELARVVPIAISADGVVVQNLQDGKNYTLTRNGEWRAAEW